MADGAGVTDTAQVAGAAVGGGPGGAMGDSAAPDQAECTEGWRAYKNVFRHWRQDTPR